MATVATPPQNGQPDSASGVTHIDSEMFDFSSVEVGDLSIPDDVIDAAVTANRARTQPKPKAEAKPEPKAEAKPEQAATVATEPKPAEAPASRHPATLLERAKKYNVPAAAVEAMDTAALTDLLFSITESRAAGGGKKTETQSASASDGRIPAAPHATGTQTAPSAAPEAFDWGEHPWIDPETGAETKKKYTDADLNPAIASAIKKLAKEIGDIKGVVEVAKQSAAQARVKSQDERFDAEFSRFPSLLGTGPGASLVGKPELDRRKAVYDATVRFYKAMPDEMRAAFPLSKAIDLQMKTLFNADPQAATAAASEEEEVKKWNQATTQRPSRRTPGGGKTGRQEAIETVEQWTKENKGEGFGEETSLDEFL